MTDERRKYTRVPVGIEVEIVPEDGRKLLGLSRDLGVNSIYVECQETVAVGTPCKIYLILGERELGVGVNCQGTSVRVDGGMTRSL